MTFFDRNRIFRGRMDGNSYHNADDVYSGRIDANGDLYNADDRYIGTLDDNGDLYDASGVYIGHVDD